MTKLDINSFRPHQGIIEFNIFDLWKWTNLYTYTSFRPHQGIIEFNIKKNILILHQNI